MLSTGTMDGTLLLTTTHSPADHSRRDDGDATDSTDDWTDHRPSQQSEHRKRTHASWTLFSPLGTQEPRPPKCRLDWISHPGFGLLLSLPASRTLAAISLIPTNEIFFASGQHFRH